MDDQHGRVAQRHHLLRDIAEQPRTQPLAAVGAHHDQVASQLVGVGHDAPRHVVDLGGVDVGRDRRRLRQPARQVGQIALRLIRQAEVTFAVHLVGRVAFDQVEQRHFGAACPHQVGDGGQHRLGQRRAVEGNQNVIEHGFILP